MIITIRKSNKNHPCYSRYRKCCPPDWMRSLQLC